MENRRYAYDKSNNLVNLAGKQQAVLANSNRLVNADYDAAGNQLDTLDLSKITYNSDGQIVFAEWINKKEYYTYVSTDQRVKKVTLTENEQGATILIEIVLYMAQSEFRSTYVGSNLSYNGESVLDNGVPVLAENTRVETRIKPNHGQVAKITNDEGSGSVSYTYNLLNNIDNNSCVLDGTSKLKCYQSYHPYGSLSESKGDIDNKQLGFSGQEHDSTDLNYFGYRYYESTSGRWTRPDPLGLRGGQLNLYAILNGNPVTFRDKFGLGGGIEEENEEKNEEYDDESSVFEEEVYPKEEDINKNINRLKQLFILGYKNNKGEEFIENELNRGLKNSPFYNWTQQLKEIGVDNRYTSTNGVNSIYKTDHKLDFTLSGKTVQFTIRSTNQKLQADEGKKIGEGIIERGKGLFAKMAAAIELTNFEPISVNSQWDEGGNFARNFDMFKTNVNNIKDFNIRYLPLHTKIENQLILQAANNTWTGKTVNLFYSFKASYVIIGSHKKDKKKVTSVTVVFDTLKSKNVNSKTLVELMECRRIKLQSDLFPKAPKLSLDTLLKEMDNPSESIINLPHQNNPRGSYDGSTTRLTGFCANRRYNPF